LYLKNLLNEYLKPVLNKKLPFEFVENLKKFFVVVKKLVLNVHMKVFSIFKCHPMHYLRQMDFFISPVVFKD
jgi:hypothetical protein